jgi:hypothetical protein
MAQYGAAPSAAHLCSVTARYFRANSACVLILLVLCAHAAALPGAQRGIAVAAVLTGGPLAPCAFPRRRHAPQLDHLDPVDFSILYCSARPGQGRTVHARCTTRTTSADVGRWYQCQLFPSKPVHSIHRAGLEHRDPGASLLQQQLNAAPPLGVPGSGAAMCPAAPATCDPAAEAGSKTYCPTLPNGRPGCIGGCCASSGKCRRSLCGLVGLGGAWTGAPGQRGPPRLWGSATRTA